MMMRLVTVAFALVATTWVVDSAITGARLLLFPSFL